MEAATPSGARRPAFGLFEVWLAQRQHQAIRPGEECASMEHVEYFELLQAHLTQARDVLLACAGWRPGERHRGIDYGLPAIVQVEASSWLHTKA